MKKNILTNIKVMFLHALQDFENYAFSVVPFLQKNEKETQEGAINQFISK